MNNRQVTGIAGLVVLILALAAAIPTVAAWWRERPLADLRRRLDEGMSAEVLEDVDLFLARHPASRPALSLKARALVNLGRWSEANQTFSQARAESPEELRAWATALTHLRRWSDALPLLLRLLELDANDPLALKYATSCQFQLGQRQTALETAARLSGIPGHEVDGWFLAGVIHRAEGNTLLALENWDRIQAQRGSAHGLPISPAEFFLVQGEDLLAIGAPRAALAKFQKSRELQQSLIVELRLGKAWAQIGDDTQAAAAWTRALAHDANHEEARNGLAEIALQRADAEGALSWLEPLVSSPSLSSTTAQLMERTHTLLGNEDELVLWQRRTAALRKRERADAAFKRKFQSDYHE